MADHNLEGKVLADYIVQIIKDKKGRDVKRINVKKLTILTEYLVISTVEVAEQGRAIYREIEKNLKQKGKWHLAIERDTSDEWIVIDYGSVIVHLMTEEKRHYYDLEDIFKNIRRTESLKAS